MTAKDKWNSEADEFNQWSSLSDDEKEELIEKYESDINIKRKEQDDYD